MKLDVTAFRYITKDEFRMMTAIEMGMRNHELVPVPLIESIAKLTRSSGYKIIQNLLKNKLVAHENKVYDGYRLTYKGYDFLALRALAARGTITGVGRRIGVGKESDVHACQGANGEMLALKLHRLGRISFRAIKSKRDYLQHRSHGSWMYMARLAALKEFAYMKALYDEGFPVPTPVDQNRHVVVMSFIEATPMYSIRDMPRPHVVLERLMRLLIRLGRSGIVHGDFNEFNLLIGDEQKVHLIDFPQIVHLTHPNAREFFDRDCRSIREWFRKKCDLVVEEYPSFDEVLREVEADNGAVMASLNVQGISRDDDAMLVAAHASTSNSNSQHVAEEGEKEDDEDEDSEDAEEEAQDGFSGLVPEGGRKELVEAEDEVDESALLEDAGYPDGDNRDRPADARNTKLPDQEGSGDDDEDDSEDDSGSEASEGPGQVADHNAKRRTRKRQTAKEARKNLQRQQKQKPAKANNQKVREMRNARHQVKEHPM
jgi:RIO kinase 2